MRRVRPEIRPWADNQDGRPDRAAPAAVRFATIERLPYPAGYRQSGVRYCWASLARYRTSPGRNDWRPLLAPGLRTGTASAVTDSVGSDGLGYHAREKAGSRERDVRREGEGRRYQSWGSLRKNAIVAEVKTGHKRCPVGFIAGRLRSTSYRKALLVRRRSACR